MTAAVRLVGLSKAQGSSVALYSSVREFAVAAAAAAIIVAAAAAQDARERVPIAALRSFREDEAEAATAAVAAAATAADGGGDGSCRVPVRSERGYGVPWRESESAIYTRLAQRRVAVARRVRIVDWSVGVALVGLVLAIVSIELETAATAATTQNAILTLLTRPALLISVGLLDSLVIAYHCVEVAVRRFGHRRDGDYQILSLSQHLQIVAADTGVAGLGMTRRRRLKLAVELLVCSCSPLCPGVVSVDWLALGESGARGVRARLPINALLVLPMFARVYLIARFAVLHSTPMQVREQRRVSAAASSIALHIESPRLSPRFSKHQHERSPHSIVLLSTSRSS